MQFRLRTLLIVITLACLCFAWLSFVRQRAQFHRSQAADLISQIAAAEQHTRDETDFGILALAAGKTPTKTTHLTIGDGPDRVTFIESARTARVVNDEMADEWHLAVHHTRKAKTFDRASLQPWVLL